MPEANLKELVVYHSASSLNAWQNKDFSLLLDSKASEFIKRIIEEKAEVRPNRFFGEAVVASKSEMLDGWYSSFKWLTAQQWITGKGLKTDFQRQYREALLSILGSDNLIEIQSRANALRENRDYKSMNGNEIPSPVAPDLILRAPHGVYRFIECKRPNDSISISQLAGLALIQKYIGPSVPLTVEINHLYPDGSKPPRFGKHDSNFLKLLEMV